MALLHQQTSLSVSQLAHMLGVSEVTIRKDLTLLEQQQMLYRVHGSAILANPYIQERHVNDKEKLCSDQKRAIGAYAARLVEPRDTILIASGTTTLAMAREIREVEELTAITTVAERRHDARGERRMHGNPARRRAAQQFVFGRRAFRRTDAPAVFGAASSSSGWTVSISTTV